MNFGQAIEKMKYGDKVSRKEWKEALFTGKKPFIFIGRHTGITANTPLILSGENEENEDCIMYCTKRGKYQTNWMPTQEDMLADDWETYTSTEEINMHRIVLADTDNAAFMKFSSPIGWKIMLSDSEKIYISKKIEVGRVDLSYDVRWTLAFDVCGMKPFEGYRDVLVCEKLFSVYCQTNMCEGTVQLITLPLSYETANKIIRLGDVRTA